MIIVIALSFSEFTATGIGFTLFFALYILLLIVAGLLLVKRKKTGLLLGWVLMPLILIAFPIGTIIGIFIITKITKTDVKALLK